MKKMNNSTASAGWWCGDEDRNCGCWSVANTSWSHPICIHQPSL